MLRMQVFTANTFSLCTCNRTSYDRSNVTFGRPSRSILHSNSQSTREGVDADDARSFHTTH